MVLIFHLVSKDINDINEVPLNVFNSMELTAWNSMQPFICVNACMMLGETTVKLNDLYELSCIK